MAEAIIGRREDDIVQFAAFAEYACSGGSTSLQSQPLHATHTAPQRKTSAVVVSRGIGRRC